MRENRHRKLIGICARRSLVIRVRDDYSRKGSRLGKLVKLIRRQRGWIDKMETVGAPDGRRKELTLYRRIVALPDPETREELLEIGGRHERRMAGLTGSGKAWHCRCST